MYDLKKAWIQLASKYSHNDNLINELWIEIEKHYSHKKRHYHNLSHLEYLVAKANIYKEKLTDFDTILFAIYYHDIVYKTSQQDNEQKSAEFAGERLAKLGVPADNIIKCLDQILSTKDHKDNNDNDTNYLVDFDLAILGDTAENYRDYAVKIRKEYSIYPDLLYNKGRKKVLQHFLDMDRIFKTDDFYNDYEKQARQNLLWELTSDKGFV